MSEVQCGCGRPTSGAFLCDHCAKTFEIAAANISAYHADLETLRTKQARYGNAGATKGSIGKSQPLGMDARFAKAGAGSEIDHDTRNTVTAWARVILEEQPELSGPHCRNHCLHVSCGAIFRRKHPRDTVQSMCAYFQRQVRWITSEEWAPEMLDEMLDLERRLARLVDRPADRWYAGKCSALMDEEEVCDAELYALEDRGQITCPKCETLHNVTDRRDFLLDEAREVLVTATEAASALIAWTDYDGSETKLVDRIRKWASPVLDKSGRVKRPAVLYAHGSIEHLGRDRALYRLGDIGELLVRHAQREQERRMQRTA